MPPLQDPFYLVRQDIQDTVMKLQQQMSRFHGLQASNPERKSITQEVESGCNEVRWQLDELNRAVDKASTDPGRFNLTMEELNGRRKWVQDTKRKIDGMVQTLKTASSSSQLPPPENKYVQANEKFIRGNQEQTMLIMKQQDAELGLIEKQVENVGQLGRAIHEELGHQEVLLNDLEEDVDTTTSRLKAAQKKMMDVIKRSGSTTQLAVIAFLVILLVILTVLAFA